MLKVEVINIGNELLIGRTINGNLQWLGERIFNLGGYLKRAFIIRDIKEDIVESIVQSLNEKVDLILTTGGLGPTYDDITMQSVAEALELQMKINNEALEFMIRRKAPSSKNIELAYEKMATLPVGSEPLLNYVGSAPGALIEKNSTKIIVMPGVPLEMQDMFVRYVEPLLGKYSSKEIVILTEGIYEAELAPLIANMAMNYPNVYIKTHPSMVNEISHVRIELKTQNADDTIDKESEKIISWLKQNGIKFSVLKKVH